MNLHEAVPKFQAERIDLDTILSLSDQQLAALGVKTIGDRLRLNEKVRNAIDLNGRNKQESNSTGTSNLACEILQQRNTLFGRGRKRQRSRSQNERLSSLNTRKIRGTRTWTATVVCLANKYSNKIPNVDEKTTLIKAGLGMKKVQFNLDDMEMDVMEKLSSDDVTNGETVGFPQLKNCGGFELLHCQRNCRNLTLITCPWNVKSLRSYLGSQSKIYLRPIQTDLNTEPIVVEALSPVTESCKRCKKLFSVHDLRSHILTCTLGEHLGYESDELPDLHVFNVQEQQLPSQISEDTDINANILYGDIPVFSTVDVVAASIDEPSTAISSDLFIAMKTDVPVKDNNMDSPRLGSQSRSLETNINEGSSPATLSVQQINDISLQPNVNAATPVPETDDKDIRTVVASAIEHCVNYNIDDPVEILRLLQKVIVTGRTLEIEDVSQNVEGTTNFILVDRCNILNTAFDEINAITDLRPTLEVQFYGEVSF